jgi:hypothetical protein
LEPFYTIFDKQYIKQNLQSWCQIMKNILKSLLTISALSSLVIAPVILNAGQAAAQPRQVTRGTDASYVGIGGGIRITDSGNDDDGNFGGNVTARVKLGNLPVSARGNVLWNNETSAIIPEVSVDVPIARNTNFFATGGYSFVQEQGVSTPIGDRNAVVVGAGIESAVGRNVLIYTNAKLGIRSFETTERSAVTLNGGVGFSF